MEIDMSYTKIYGFMDQQLRLDGKELRVFALVYSFYDSGRRCVASTNYIAQRVCSSVRSVERAINTLIEAGLISVKRKGRMCELAVMEAGIRRRIEQLVLGKQGGSATDSERERAASEAEVSEEETDGITVSEPDLGLTDDRTEPVRSPLPKHCGTPIDEILRLALARSYGEDRD